MTKRAVLAISILAALLTGCTNGIEYESAQAPIPGIFASAEPAHGEDRSELAHPSGKVTVWSYFQEAGWIIPVLRHHYPDIEIELEIFPWDNFIERYLKAMDDGQAPDVLFADNNLLSQLVGMRIAEDLTAEPYKGEEIVTAFPESIIAPFRSLKDDHLFALPLDIGPGVAYFRRDLFEKAGLPSEPEALSSYLEQPGNWLAAADKLKKQGSWITSTDYDPIDITVYGSGFFDRELNYVRDSSAFATAIDLARQIRARGLASGLTLNSEAGQEALRDGKTAMFFNGWWYRGSLKAAAPETEGLWGIMRLPLQVYGWSGSSGTLISSDSDNKAGAWAVVSVLAQQIQNIYANSMRMQSGEWPDSGDKFFAYQRTQALYANLVSRMPPLTPTPMDGKAADIWGQFIGSSLNSTIDATQVLSDIKRLTMDSIQSDIQTLKSQRQ
ncbi:ABC transporter substrate-binding protein [Cohnella panacarvi]|uniref:ABC transporter substrate-binding protein n=1 Tax=Cohnella panacarvi TaxID=400776 RepID=UPI00047A5E16|nr:extracellular solute-binding protein [Cohnella panacarvi]